MTNIELVKEFAESLGLPYYKVLNESGAINDDALAIVGFPSATAIDLCMEYINNLQGFEAGKQLFQRAMDGQSMIFLGSFVEVLPTMTGHKVVEDELTFHINDTLYCTGVLIISK